MKGIKINNMNRKQEEELKIFNELIALGGYITQASEKHVETINNILKRRGIEDRIDEEDLFILLNKPPLDIKLDLPILQTSTNTGERLRSIIENYIWDTVKEDDIIYHFTHEKIGKMIDETNTIRQYNILKRYDDGEIKDFFEYYGVKYFKTEHYDDKFYTSFTMQIPNTPKRIETFNHFTGNEKKGARLKFRVNKSNDFFRYIDYTKDKLNILIELRDAILEKHNLHFNISGITTRLAAFYVNEMYRDEFEVRYYTHEEDEGNILFEKETNEFSFVEMNFDSNRKRIKDSILTLIDITYERDNPIFDI